MTSALQCAVNTPSLLNEFSWGCHQAAGCPATVPAPNHRLERSGHDAQHFANQFRVGCKQEAQRKRDRQHPLANGPGWQHLIHQQGGACHHTSCAAAGAEASPLAGKGQQLHKLAAFTTRSQEVVFQAVVLQEICALLLYVLWKVSVFGF